MHEWTWRRANRTRFPARCAANLREPLFPVPRWAQANRRFTARRSVQSHARRRLRRSGDCAENQRAKRNRSACDDRRRRREDASRRKRPAALAGRNRDRSQLDRRRRYLARRSGPRRKVAEKPLGVHRPGAAGIASGEERALGAQPDRSICAGASGSGRAHAGAGGRSFDAVAANEPGSRGSAAVAGGARQGSGRSKN